MHAYLASRAGPLGTFKATYTCYSMGLGGQPLRLEGGDKIVLPSDAFREVARLKLPLPLFFSVVRAGARDAAKANAAGADAKQRGARPPSPKRAAPTKPDAKNDAKADAAKPGDVQYCGVLEFSAPADTCYLPHWMMQNARVDEGGRVTIASVGQGVLSKGKAVVFQPYDQLFVDQLREQGPKFFLESALRHYSALRKGQRLVIMVPPPPNKPNGQPQRFALNVLETQPTDAVSILGNVDLKVDFVRALNAPVSPQSARGAKNAPAFSISTGGGETSVDEEDELNRALAMSLTFSHKDKSEGKSADTAAASAGAAAAATGAAGDDEGWAVMDATSPIKAGGAAGAAAGAAAGWGGSTKGAALAPAPLSFGSNRSADSKRSDNSSSTPMSQAAASNTPGSASHKFGVVQAPASNNSAGNGYSLMSAVAHAAVAVESIVSPSAAVAASDLKSPASVASSAAAAPEADDYDSAKDDGDDAAGATPAADLNSPDASDPTKQFCANCRRYIPNANFRMHAMHCARQMQRCGVQLRSATDGALTGAVCGVMITKANESAHRAFHELVACPLGCGVQIERRWTRKHTRKGPERGGKGTCPMRPLTCKFCAQPTHFQQLVTHELECGNRHETCARCSAKYLVRHKDAHTSAVCNPLCPSGCGTRVTLDKVEEHKKFQCPNRTVKCPFCQLPFPHKQKAAHEQYCGSRTEPCERCGKAVKLRDMDMHVDSGCTLPEAAPTPAPAPGRNNAGAAGRDVGRDAVGGAQAGGALNRHAGASASSLDALTLARLLAMDAGVDVSAATLAAARERDAAAARLEQEEEDAALGGIPGLGGAGDQSFDEYDPAVLAAMIESKASHAQHQERMQRDAAAPPRVGARDTPAPAAGAPRVGASSASLAAAEVVLAQARANARQVVADSKRSAAAAGGGGAARAGAGRPSVGYDPRRPITIDDDDGAVADRMDALLRGPAPPAPDRSSAPSAPAPAPKPQPLPVASRPPLVAVPSGSRSVAAPAPRVAAAPAGPGAAAAAASAAAVPDYGSGIPGLTAAQVAGLMFDDDADAQVVAVPQPARSPASAHRMSAGAGVKNPPRSNASRPAVVGSSSVARDLLRAEMDDDVVDAGAADAGADDGLDLRARVSRVDQILADHSAARDRIRAEEQRVQQNIECALAGAGLNARDLGARPAAAAPAPARPAAGSRAGGAVAGAAAGERAYVGMDDPQATYLCPQCSRVFSRDLESQQVHMLTDCEKNPHAQPPASAAPKASVTGAAAGAGAAPRRPVPVPAPSLVRPSSRPSMAAAPGGPVPSPAPAPRSVGTAAPAAGNPRRRFGAAVPAAATGAVPSVRSPPGSPIGGRRAAAAAAVGAGPAGGAAGSRAGASRGSSRSAAVNAAAGGGGVRPPPVVAAAALPMSERTYDPRAFAADPFFAGAAAGGAAAAPVRRALIPPPFGFEHAAPVAAAAAAVPKPRSAAAGGAVVAPASSVSRSVAASAATKPRDVRTGAAWSGAAGAGAGGGTPSRKPVARR